MKPVPKKEIIVRVLNDSFVKITVASEDALEWLLDNAEEFGTLMRMSNNKEYFLWVNELYDAVEVAEWIESLGVDG